MSMIYNMKVRYFLKSFNAADSLCFRIHLVAKGKWVWLELMDRQIWNTKFLFFESVFILNSDELLNEDCFFQHYNASLRTSTVTKHF